MLKVDWIEKLCSYDGYDFEWSAPHFDAVKGRYRSLLRERRPFHEGTLKDSFQKELSFPESEYSVTLFQRRIVQEVLHAVRGLEDQKVGLLTLDSYLFSEAKWDDIRKFFGWSTDTAATYKATLRNVFGEVLMLPMGKIITEDIELAINKKCVHFKYKASTIRAWLKIINRIFVYLEATFPNIRNPVRMNGKKIREARQEQKKTVAESRSSQKALHDNQSRAILDSFLADVKKGNFLGICGIVMLENGRRPIEAGGTTLGMHIAPAGESFLSAPVYEVVDGKIVNKHKTSHSIRQIPDSPVLEQVLEYFCLHVMKILMETNCNNIDWRTVPFGGKFVYNKQGDLTSIKPFSAKEVSAYVHRKLVECGITFSVTVEDGDEDSDDNRRAYSLRYTALSNLFCFLPRDKYQYIAAHRRTASRMGCEDNNRKKYYLAPQVQREIYEAMESADIAIYGSDIIERVRQFLGLDM